MLNRFRLVFGLFLLIFPSILIAGNTTEYIRFFSSLPSRVPGYHGHRQAADFVEQHFKRAGLQNVSREKFKVAVPVHEYAYISSGGRKVDLHSLWPNLIRTTTLPPEGIKGNIVYAGKGDWSLLEGREIEGNIIMLDFDSRDIWQTLAMMGARAFIFTGDGNVSRIEAEKKFLNTPIDVPRFYVERDAAFLRDIARRGEDVELFARMNWQNVEDYNIFGYIEGSDENLKEDIIIIQSYYDSISVVPAIAPGATSAVGISTLLSLVDYFSETPPARTVLFLATSSHFQSMAGINDFVQRHMRNDTYFRSKIPEKDLIDPVLFIGLELSDKGSGLGVWHNSYYALHQRAMAGFGRKFSDYSDEVAGRYGYDREFALVNGIMPERGRVWNTFLPGKIRTDGEHVIYAGNPALSLVTVNDGRWKVDTPSDTFDKINLSNVEKQAFFIKRLIERALNDEMLMPDTDIDIRDIRATLNVNVVTFDPVSSFVPSDPVENAIVVPRFVYRFLPYEMKTAMGVRNSHIAITDSEGRASFSNLNTGGRIFLSGFFMDEETGSIVLAPDLGSGGAQQYPVEFPMDFREKNWMHVLFESRSVDVFELIDPQFLIPLEQVDIFDRANSLPSQYGYYIRPPFLTRTSYAEPFALAFAKPGTEIKVIGSSGLLGRRLLLLNSQETELDQEKAEGLGFPVDYTRAIFNTPYQGARDMVILNMFRRNNFEQFGIKNERLVELQNESQRLLRQADEAREDKRWYDFLKFSRQALALESRAYPDVRNTANDVVQGVIFYFMLLLPFAYFAERLIFGFVKTEKRIAAIFGVFLLIYWIMRLVHPAFQLTEAPEVILLSFIVLTLAGIVIFIISSKFEEQMQKMKMESTNIYEADVGRITATATAFSLGVANMKRRRVRTALTSITLILLTFTVLSFTSIQTHMRFNRVLRPHEPAYEGILYRDRSHAPITHKVFGYLENEFSELGTIAPRAWFIEGELGQRTAVDVFSRGKSFLSSGLLGLSVEEIMPFQETLRYGQWFSADDEHAVILSLRMAEHLGIDHADVGKAQIGIFGKDFVLKGLFDGREFGSINDLDDEIVTPVDFSVIPELELREIQTRQRRAYHTATSMQDAFPRSDPDNIVLMPYATVMDMDGTINSVAVSFKEGVDGVRATENFVSKLAVNIFAGLDGRTFVYSSVGLTSFAGLGNLLIPILIAALIVLNTMLGSVYERIREIGTYSAVGLAPVHISSLFLAESLVYAVIGAVTGYLLGQVVARALIATDMLRGLILNYSSLSAVFATIIIFITVLLSTLYPARKASQMAVPDVTRRWELPEPKGDKWDFEFPFTLNEMEVLGMVTFLTEYYNAYQDISIGNFYTAGAKLTCEKLSSGKNKYEINTKVWLAPFDLAVSQNVKIVLEPMGEYDFYLINLLMERAGGEQTDWKRLNRRFLDSIRKQFLVWRTIHEGVKKEYDEKGKKLLKLV